MVLRSPSFNPPLKPLANFDQTWQRWSLDGPLLELYPMTTHNHPRWLPWQKIENIDKIFPLKLLDQLGSNFGEAVLGWSPFRILSDNFADQPRWLPWRSIENSAKNQFKTISETTGPIVTKIWGIGSWMVPFRSVSDVPACQPRRLSFLRVENSAKNHKSPLTLLGPYLGGMGGSPAYQNFIRTIPTAHRDGHHH